jgi:hypothetical protein
MVSAAMAAESNPARSGPPVWLDPDRSEPAKKSAPTGKRAPPPVIVPRPVIEGGLFKRTVVPGISELRESMAGLALVDINKDGLIDIVAVTSPRPEVRSGDDQDRLRVWLNKGGLRFEPHAIQIRGSKLTCQQFGHAAVVPNLVDFNGDGFLDLFVTRTRARGNTLLVSQGRWDEFLDVSAQMGIANKEGYNRQSSIGDVNGDGWLDIAVGCDTIGRGAQFGYPLQRLYVFQPKGARFEDGHFEDIGGTSLVPDFGGPYDKDPAKRRSGPGIILRDIDNDGALDLVQPYHLDSTGVGPDDPEGVHEQKFGVWCWHNLLKKTGRFRFEKVTGNGLATEGQMRLDAERKHLSVVQHSLSLPYITMFDMENRGLLDALLVGPSTPGWHIESDPIAGCYWKNLGGFQFQERTREVGLDVISWPRRRWHEFWGLTTPPAMLRPPRLSTYPWTGLPTRPPGDGSFYWGDVIVGDFDNDGNLDFVLCSRDEHDALRGLAANILFLNQGNGTFKPMPMAFSGINTIGICGEAADLNNDGLLDLVFAAQPGNSWGSGTTHPPEQSYESTVYINTGLHGARKNHWLRLRFSGVRDAELVGARVAVTEPGTDRLLGTRVVFSNQGYRTGSALEAHFGLGRRDKVDVAVTLLNGKSGLVRNVAADHYFDFNLASQRIRAVRTQ